MKGRATPAIMLDIQQISTRRADIGIVGVQIINPPAGRIRARKNPLPQITECRTAGPRNDACRGDIVIPSIAMDMETSHVNMGIWTSPNSAMSTGLDFFERRIWGTGNECRRRWGPSGVRSARVRNSWRFGGDAATFVVRRGGDVANHDSDKRALGDFIVRRSLESCAEPLMTLRSRGCNT